MTVPAWICQTLASRLPGGCMRVCARVCVGVCGHACAWGCMGAHVCVHICARVCACLCMGLCRGVCRGVHGYVCCFGHEQLSHRARSARCTRTALWGAFWRAPSSGCSRSAPPGHACLQRCRSGDPLPVPWGAMSVVAMSMVAVLRGPARPARGQLGSRRQLCIPKGTASRTLAWLLPGAGGVKSVWGAEERCTLCLPKILASQERGKNVPNLSLSGIFEGVRGDACLKSSFAKHPRRSLPGGVPLSPVLGEAEMVPSPGEPPGLNHVPVPARLCPT